MDEIILQVRHLSKSFGKHEVLRDIDFTVNRGDVTSIIGASGSGKSTLLRCVNLLETPTSGEITFHGENILTRKGGAAAYRTKVGMVFQSFNLFNNMSVLDNCTVGQIKVLKKSAAEAKELAMKYLTKVGMAPYINAKPRQLSGGQKQRVAIAGGIAMEPKVLILDEPTAGLDPAGAASILANIETYRQANHATVILVSHSMEDVARLADRLVVVSQGTLPYVGTPREVFSHGEALESMGLAVPAMNRVFSRVRAMGVDIDPAVYTVEQAKAAILDALRKKGGR